MPITSENYKLFLSVCEQKLQNYDKYNRYLMARVYFNRLKRWVHKNYDEIKNLINECPFDYMKECGEILSQVGDKQLDEKSEWVSCNYMTSVEDLRKQLDQTNKEYYGDVNLMIVFSSNDYFEVCRESAERDFNEDKELWIDLDINNSPELKKFKDKAIEQINSGGITKSQIRYLTSYLGYTHAEVEDMTKIEAADIIRENKSK